MKFLVVKKELKLSHYLLESFNYIDKIKDKNMSHVHA